MTNKSTLSSSPNLSQEDTLSQMIEAIQQQNLVYNYNFLYYSNQSSEATVKKYGHPDAWIYTDKDPAGTIGKDNDYCKITTTVNSDMTFKQALHEFPRWENKLLGQTVTAKAHINLKKDNHVAVSLSDGIGINTQEIYAPEDGDFVFEVQLTLDNNAQELYVLIQNSSNAANILISKVYANIGSIALDTLPCIVTGIIGERKQYIATEFPPAEELSLCEVAKELTTNHTRLNSVLNCRFGAGANGSSLLPDVRGYFSRAWDNGANNDPDASARKMLGNVKETGDLVGTSEEDCFEKHQHKLTYATVANNQGTSGPGTGLNTGASSQTEETGGAETRPINVAELKTIKWS